MSGNFWGLQMSSPKIPKWLAGFCANRFPACRLPKTCDKTDVLHYGIVEFLAVSATEKYQAIADERARNKYMRLAIVGAIEDELNRQFFGPSLSVKAAHKKRGLPTDWGEVSLSDFADPETGECFLAAPEQEECSGDDYKHMPTIAQVCALIRAAQTMDPEANISTARRADTKHKTRFHTECTLCGRRVFIGQFDHRIEAVRRRQTFAAGIIAASVEMLA